MSLYLCLYLFCSSLFTNFDYYFSILLFFALFMSIRKLPDGRWQLDMYEAGRGSKRIREKFDSKGEATRRKNYIEEQKVQGKPWNSHSEKRRLQDLIDTWYTSYGMTTKDGKSNKAKFTDACKEMGNPKVNDFDKKMFDEWRTHRLKRTETKLIKRNKPQTINKTHRLMIAMFNRLISSGHWEYANPLEGLKKLNEVKPSPGFLSDEQIYMLLDELRKTGQQNAVLIAEVCLRTGARWSEAENLTGGQLFPGMPPKIAFTQTKGDDDRLVPISQEFYQRLPKVAPGDLVFGDQSNWYSIFSNVWIRMNFNLPKGQKSHALRHTFASNFMKNGGNIKVLQKVLGHKDVTMTMRYVHFAPEYLATAINLNPLAALDG